MIAWNGSYFKIPADIPHALYCGPGLNETLDDRPGDDETIIGADQDIPRIKKVHLLSPCHVPLVSPLNQKVSNIFINPNPYHARNNSASCLNIWAINTDLRQKRKELRHRMITNIFNSMINLKYDEGLERKKSFGLICW